ncbi:hypothetical protein PR202_gb09012 [Eleusine coracana subsp. coracana]|uniref:EF-hand domain-containing protein n=1 Tax=Eleusine coracana subsp. coracana TaxID=191504 RepID=A0AAV5EFM4_ELECO|nr:hypothetical protein PR202_gb09012 [Eleusine coracana subsp. coracana]
MVAPGDELAAVIARIDADGDGCVDISEFADLNGDGDGGGRDEEADLREAFGVFDRNGDGFITVDELRAVLASLGMKQGRDEQDDDCRRMIGQVDRDGDGRVDFTEFKEMMRGGGFATLGSG